MKILITGATGYLGEKIVREAHERGHAVRALCRNPSNGVFPEGVEAAQGDLSRPESLAAAMRDCRAVIHTAGLVSIWRRDVQDFYRVNVDGTGNVLKAAKNAGVERVIYTSSFFALGPTDERPADESWWNPDESAMTPYARSKMNALQKVREWIQDGLDIIPVYPVLIYGPGKATQGNYITKMVDDYIHRRIPGYVGDGRFRWTYSFVDDVAKGHLLALENGRQGESYILGGEDASLNELFDILQELTGIKRPRLKIPYPLAKGYACMEELRARLSNNYLPKLTRDTVDVYLRHWRFSSQKAITELGYTRTPLKMGLIKILESLGFTFPEDRKTIL
ncbi:MAG: SDR family oxidoreductase [Candidatus Omnitrophica bacterium]|nr:SDR family oxidoreductase [Candidatus Omnitrophota bacterium]